MSNPLTPLVGRRAVGRPNHATTFDVCLRLSSLRLHQRRRFQTSTALTNVKTRRNDTFASTSQFVTPSNLPQRTGPEPKSVALPTATLPDPGAAAASVKAKLKAQQDDAMAE